MSKAKAAMASAKNITYYGIFGYTQGNDMSDFHDQTPLNCATKSMTQADTWQLYGTVGCHLCDIAESLLNQVQSVVDINWQKVDIADLTETEMLEYAYKIPVLVTPNKTLYYPFSIMDIMALAN